jgi:hypothetical protein
MFQARNVELELRLQAWHAWALLNFRIALQLGSAKKNALSPITQRNHVVAALNGFVTAINIGTNQALQRVCTAGYAARANFFV